ncbi:MAG: hypothetical protein L6R36_004733 [Xanthoria steineri]|nr:MAG: hypothetical protein L6R36_004733 [Xanthoria steineri]
MSPNQSPMPHEASAVDTKMQVVEQTSGAVTASRSATFQQPMTFGTAQQSPAVHRQAASYNTTQQSLAQSVPYHYHTSSVGGPRPSAPPYPSYEYPSFQPGSQYPSSYYNMPPYPTEPVPYPEAVYEHQQMPRYCEPAQAQYYYESEVTSFAPSSNPVYSHTDVFMAQPNRGDYRPSTPTMDLAGPSYPHQSVPETVTSPPTQQPAPPNEQPQTPISGPSKHSQASDPTASKVSRSPRMKTMKHLTCYYWGTLGNCRNGDNCYYAHTWNAEGQASKPIRKEPGSTSTIAPSTSLSIVLTMTALEPAVAGKNAQKDNPAYIDWNWVHAPFNPPRPRSPLHPKIQAQIADIHKKHAPALSLDPRLQRLQEAEARSIQMRSLEAAGAAAHMASLDARMKALDELIERLERNKTSTADAATTESAAATKDALSDPPQQESKAIKLNTEATRSTAVDTSTVLTDLTAENQALRGAVQEMANIVSSVMASDADLRTQRTQLHDSLFHKIIRLPVQSQGAFMKAFNQSTEGFEGSLQAEEEAKMAMYAIRKKMINLGHGGLLTAWDRDFCSSTD